MLSVNDTPETRAIFGHFAIEAVGEMDRRRRNRRNRTVGRTVSSSSRSVVYLSTGSEQHSPSVLQQKVGGGSVWKMTPRKTSWLRLGALVGVPRAFGGLFCHSPFAILCLPALVSRSSPGNSSMYPSWISRSLCSGGIVRCIGPLAQLRSDTNSSWLSGVADKSCAIPQICARNRPFSS